MSLYCCVTRQDRRFELCQELIGRLVLVDTLERSKIFLPERKQRVVLDPHPRGQPFDARPLRLPERDQIHQRTQGVGDERGEPPEFRARYGGQKAIVINGERVEAELPKYGALLDDGLSPW